MFYRLFTIGLVGNKLVASNAPRCSLVLPVDYDRISWKHDIPCELVNRSAVLPIVYDRISWK